MVFYIGNSDEYKPNSNDYDPAVFGSNRRVQKPSLFDRVKKVGQFLSDKKVDIAMNVAIGVGAKVLAASVLTASGGLAVAVGGAALASVGRVVAEHVKERRSVTIQPEDSRDWGRESNLLVQKIFSKDTAKKMAFGSAISGATFGLLSGGDAVLHHTEAGQHAANWVGEKLSSVFNAHAPDFMKGWFAKPVAPVAPIAVVPVVTPVVVDAPVVPEETPLVTFEEPKPEVKHHVHHHAHQHIPKVNQDALVQSQNEIAQEQVVSMPENSGDALPEIAPVEDEPLPPLLDDTDIITNVRGDVIEIQPEPEAPVEPVPSAPEAVYQPTGDDRVDMLHDVVAAAEQDPATSPADLEALKNLKPEQVAKICDIEMPKTFGAENHINVDCKTYKPEMDAGDVSVIKNVTEPDPKKGLRVLFANAKEKTFDFFNRAVVGDGGVVPEMVNEAQNASQISEMALQ